MSRAAAGAVYRRIMLKLSGEVFGWSGRLGVDPDVVSRHRATDAEVGRLLALR